MENMTSEIMTWILGSAGAVVAALGSAIRVVYTRLCHQYDGVKQELDDCHEKHAEAEQRSRDVETRLCRLEGYHDGYRAAVEEKDVHE